MSVVVSMDANKTEALAREFGQDLYAARRDSCDEEACFEFLAELYPNRLREVLANYRAASHYAGQHYIDAEMRRAG